MQSMKPWILLVAVIAVAGCASIPENDSAFNRGWGDWADTVQQFGVNDQNVYPKNLADQEALLKEMKKLEQSHGDSAKFKEWLGLYENGLIVQIHLQKAQPNGLSANPPECDYNVAMEWTWARWAASLLALNKNCLDQTCNTKFV